MAKGKHAAALFEVIHSGRFPQKPEMRTPKWWFKRKDQADAKAAAANVTRAGANDGASAGATSGGSILGEAPETASDPTMGATARAMLGEHGPEATQSSSPSNQQGNTRQLAGDHPGSGDAGDGAGGAVRTSSLDVSIDPRQHRITFRITYSSAIITAFALVVAVGLAYAVGRKMSRGPAPAVASETTEQLRARPPRPDVLNINSAGNASPSTSAHNSARGGGAGGGGAGGGAGGGNTSGAPVSREPDGGISSRINETPSPSNSSPATDNGQSRVVGTNYLVIQSYPDEKTANEIRDTLLKAGVGCTVEKQRLRGLNAGWFTVVGTQGFVRCSGAEYEAYKKRLEQLSQQFAQSKRSFKAFAMMPYKWDLPGQNN